MMDGKYLSRNEEVGVVPAVVVVEEVAAAAAAVPVEAVRQVPHHLLDHLAPRLVRGGLQEAALPAAVALGARSKLPHPGRVYVV